jgi:hypothetical protein
MVTQAATHLASATYHSEVSRIASKLDARCFSCVGRRCKLPTYASQRCFESILKHILAIPRVFSCKRSKKSFSIGRNACEDFPIYWQSRPTRCFTSTSARIASQTMFESLFRLRPLLDLSKQTPNESTALDRCLSRPDASVGEAGRSAATNCFTESFELRSL